MKTYRTLLLGCAMFAPALVIASGAQAQVSNVAIVDPEAVILSAKALQAANQTIATTYKPQLDQANTRAQALQTELNTLMAPLDTNKDRNLSDDEIAAAQAAKNPALARIDAAQKAGQVELDRLRGPATLAQLYAIEQLSQRYGAAMKAVVDTKKINLLLSAGTVQFAGPAADVSTDVRNELDRANPTVPTTPPAGWQPSQQTVQLLQQYNQIVQAQAIRAARAAQGTAPATTAKPPVGR